LVNDIPDNTTPDNVTPAQPQDNPEDILFRARRTAKMMQYQGHLMSTLDTSALINELAGELEKMRVVKGMEDSVSVPVIIQEKTQATTQELSSGQAFTDECTERAPLVASMDLVRDAIAKGVRSFCLDVSVTSAGKTLRVEWGSREDE
jgi:hypothetical protein